MMCVPGVDKVGVMVADPALVVTTPSWVVPSRKVTVPLGVLEGGAPAKGRGPTVALNVNWPGAACGTTERADFKWLLRTTDPGYRASWFAPVLSRVVIPE